MRNMWLPAVMVCLFLCACTAPPVDTPVAWPTDEMSVTTEADEIMDETQGAEETTGGADVTEEMTDGTETTDEPEPSSVAETGPAETEPAETVPLHSELYLEDYTVEQVIEYFCEVVLDTEYSGGGNYQLVQKWVEPLKYGINGEATQEDLDVLTHLFEQLNEVEGFPGIVEPKEEHDMVNLYINFYGREDFYANMGEVVGGQEADGAVQYWYSDLNDIYHAKIGYRTDIDQSIRNSVLPEEVINGLGITDTMLREDSITYQFSSFNLEPSEMDWLIIRLLYHPEIKPGMNREECIAVIEKLYY